MPSRCVPGNGAGGGALLLDGCWRGTWRIDRSAGRVALQIAGIARIGPELAEEGTRLLDFLAPDANRVDIRTPS